MIINMNIIDNYRFAPDEYIVENGVAGFEANITDDNGEPIKLFYEIAPNPMAVTVTYLGRQFTVEDTAELFTMGYFALLGTRVHTEDSDKFYPDGIRELMDSDIANQPNSVWVVGDMLVAATYNDGIKLINLQNERLFGDTALSLTVKEAYSFGTYMLTYANLANTVVEAYDSGLNEEGSIKFIIDKFPWFSTVFQ